ncbi:hypothetical protein FH972_000426 [Carpinus fangiana]|uniref:F-box domain-containing protein n=1 Tax=Carpinus fangiana TaxID=176857 RepID=A0A5N6Q8T8_9ROSI|nr:hypothetical protein FH972_000426 [Carpinus fangiana]
MSMANELPEELVTEVLLCLPVVSLLRFNCVCKSWYALIAHQNFIRKHLLHNKNNNTLLLLWRNQTTQDDVVSTLSYETLPASLTQPLPLPFTEVSIFVGSCDGLVCLRDYDSLNLVIWNPATKETKVVPKSSLSRFSDDYRIESGIGFGFDAKTCDYKIINFFSLFDNYESDFEGNVPCYRLSEAFDFDDDWEGVLSFDMSGEVFLKTPLPDDVLNGHVRGWRSFFVLNESIAMALWSSDEEFVEVCCDIWLLLEVGVKDSWTRLFTVGPVTGTGDLPFWKNDTMFFKTYDRLVVYNPFTKGRTNLPIRSYSCCSVTYVETLVSVKGGNEF